MLKKSKSSLELPDNKYFKRMWISNYKKTHLGLSDDDFKIATKYMNAFNKDPGYCEGESKIKGVSKIELVVHFAKYTNDCKPNDKFIHKSSNFYLKLIQEQPDLFKDMMASMLDGETKYDLDKLKGIFKYKFYSKILIK